MDETKHYSLPGNVFYWLRYYYKMNKSIIVMSVLQIIFSCGAPLIGIYLPMVTLDMLQKGVTTERFALVLGLFALLATAVYSMEAATENGKYYIANACRTDIIAELFLKSLQVPYSIPESGKGKIVYEKALDAVLMGDMSAASTTLRVSIELSTNVICFFLYSTVLGTLSVWIIGLLIGLSLLNCLWVSLNIKYRESVREEEAYINRRFYYVKSALGDTRAAKDVRIFGMSSWLIGIKDKVIGQGKELNKKIYRRNAWQEQLSFFTAMIRDLCAYGFLIYQTTCGNVTASEFVLYFGAITGFSAFVTGIVECVGQLRAAGNATDYFRTYMELSEEDMENGNRHMRELEMPYSIEFQDVSFSYEEELEEGKEESTKRIKVFDHFNLKIEAGEKIALVGVNGAGKTTFVKLLCGISEPEEGNILINGVDRRHFPKGEWYNLFSVVFQEQLIMPISIGENIGMDAEGFIDRDRAWLAIEKAGLKDMFLEKEITLDTFLTKVILKSGVELSGGQQQRLLLARALYKDGPILVLDEPTAALDPIAESQVYEQYQKYTENKTAVFISHRLASTRFSDRIVMIEQGKIVEMGTHSELMEKGGAYAKMYQVQSDYYSDKK